MAHFSILKDTEMNKVSMLICFYKRLLVLLLLAEWIVDKAASLVNKNSRQSLDSHCW